MALKKGLEHVQDDDYRSEAECSNGMSRPRQCCGRSELMLKGQTRQRWRQQAYGVDCHKASSAMMAQSVIMEMKEAVGMRVASMCASWLGGKEAELKKAVRARVELRSK